MGSSQSRDRTRVSCIAGRFFTPEPPGTPCFHFGVNLFCDLKMTLLYTAVIQVCSLSSRSLSPRSLRLIPVQGHWGPQRPSRSAGSRPPPAACRVSPLCLRQLFHRTASLVSLGQLWRRPRADSSPSPHLGAWSFQTSLLTRPISPKTLQGCTEPTN